MAATPSDHLRLSKREAILHKVVFELRYQYGLTYLDRCGRTANRIMRECPEWTLLSEHPNPQSAPLVNLETSAAFNFNARKLDLSLERNLKAEPLADNDVKNFADQVGILTSIVIDQLGLEEFTRIGFRAWYVFQCQSRQDAEQWLKSLGCYSVSESVEKAFQGAIEAINVAVVVSGSDRKYRLSFNGVERQAELEVGQAILNIRARDLPKNQREHLQEQTRVKKILRQSPEHAAMIDVDVFQEDPLEVAPQDFVETSYSELFVRLKQAVGDAT